MNKNKYIIAIVILVGVVGAGFVILSKKATDVVIVNEKTDEIAVVDENMQNNLSEEVADNTVENSAEEVIVNKESVVVDKVPDPVIVTEKKADSIPEVATKSSYAFKITNKLIDFGYQNSSERKIDTIIIHSSYDALGDDPFIMSGIVKEFKEYGVSAHYLIGRDGTIYRLVEDKNIAWHAGVSKVPDGRTGVNGFSIGIEVVNTKSDKFTADQYSALNKLIGQLKEKYDIKYVLGHNQIAPGRKDDPWNIDWGKVKK